jgi:integrase
MHGAASHSNQGCLMASKRRFGRVRRLPSGRWQARYLGPDGLDRPADRTFATKTDAERWLILTEAEIVRGDWLSPEAGRTLFEHYAQAWVLERPALRPKTLQLYNGLVRLHLVPTFGTLALQDITDPRVRRWRKGLLDAGVGEVTVAKAYRLLKAIMSTAVDDGMIHRNPCRIKGAGQEHSPERPVITVRQVFALAGSVPQRFRLLVLLAAFASMRWGELAALRRRHIDLVAGTVTVELSVVELVDGSLFTGPPKSEAGRRIMTLPPFLLPDIRTHLEQYTGPDDESLVFTGPMGAPVRRSNFSRIWRSAIAATGLSGIHIHDLRHAGNHFAASTGASLAELMGRMGHSTTRAALIYQHRTMERDRLIAAAISAAVEAELSESERASGT